MPTKKNTIVRLMASRKQLEYFDEEVRILEMEDTLPTHAPLREFVKKLPGHPRLINGLYYANKQQNLLTLLRASPEELDALDNTHSIKEISGLNAVMEPYSALHALMPGVLSDEPSISLQALFQTHIQSTDGKTLIPVRNLAVDDAHPVTKEEYHRLRQHSSLTQSLLSAKEAYDAIASDSSTLLGQLTQLCRELGLNSAAGRGQ